MKKTMFAIALLCGAGNAHACEDPTDAQIKGVVKI
jgi:hypothetical protein